MDPDLPFSQGWQPVFGTNSRKTGTIVLRNLQYAVRSPRFGMKLPPKNHQIAPIGGTIASDNGL
jgi:hypothetical protein